MRDGSVTDWPAAPCTLRARDHERGQRESARDPGERRRAGERGERAVRAAMERYSRAFPRIYSTQRRRVVSSAHSFRALRARYAVDETLQRRVANQGGFFRGGALLPDGGTERGRAAALAFARTRAAHDRTRASRRESEGNRHRHASLGFDGGKRHEALPRATRPQKLPHLGHSDLARTRCASPCLGRERGNERLHRTRIP
jgi:hypothetical protein